MAVSAPVLSSQSTHTFKLPGVVRDNNQSPAACVTGNHLIEWPDRASLTGKLCPDLPRMGGGRRVIIQNIKSGNKPSITARFLSGIWLFRRRKSAPSG